MIELALDGSNVVLLNDLPNFIRGFTASAYSVTDSKEGLTKRETRRPYSGSLRFDLNFSVVFSGANLRTAQGMLRTLGEQQVLMPFWPAVSPWSSRAAVPISGGLRLVYKKDWSQYAVYTVEPLWPSPDDLVVPLVLGNIKPVTFMVESPVQASVDFEFSENSPLAYAITFDASAFDDGPALPDYTPKLLPFTPTFRKISQAVQSLVKRDLIGFGRKNLTTFYQHDDWEDQTSTYWHSTLEEIAKCFYWFQTQSGQGAAFWAMGATVQCVLDADAAPGDVSIVVQEVGSARIGDQLSVIGLPGLFRKIVNIVGTTVTLESAFGVALAAGSAFRRLTLCKQSDQKLKVTFLSPFMAFWTAKLDEVRPENFLPGDETIGETIGQLPERCLLFDLAITLPGGTYHERMTSHEKDLTLSGNTFSAKRISSGEISQTIFLEDDQVEILCALADSNYLRRAASISIEAPLIITIVQAEVNGTAAINPEFIFYGELTKISPEGPQAKTMATTGGNKFGRQVPRILFQRDCNNTLFDFACAILRADWKFTAVMTAVGTPGYPFTFNVGTLTNPIGNAYVPNADWFSGGWVELGSGPDLQRRAILRSTNPVAGALTLTLDRDPFPFPANGDPVTLYPGCDGLFSTCRDKFSNDLNFLGFPQMPVANPSLINKQQTGAGGKK